MTDHRFLTLLSIVAMTACAAAATAQPANAPTELDDPLAELGVVDEAPGDTTAELIAMYMRDGDYDKALATCRDAIGENPGDLGLRGRYAAILMAMGDMNRAYAEAREVVDASPDDANANMVIANIALRSGLPALAVPHAKRAAEAAPYKLEARRLLARAHIGNESFEEARRVLEALLLIRPDDVKSLVNIGSVYARTEQHERAIQAVKKAAEVSPESPLPILAMGDIYLAGTNTAKAVESYRKALDVVPNHVPALNNLASLLTEDPDARPEAIELARRAWRLAPGSPQVADTLGWLYVKTSELERAAGLLSLAARRRPNDATVLYHVAAILHARGRPEKAESYLLKALRLPGSFAEGEAARALLDAVRGGENTQTDGNDADETQEDE